MNCPLFISWRYQRGKQTNRLVSIISFFSNMGIALGVAVLIIGLSAMNGFERELKNRILSIVPHIEILSYPPQAGPLLDVENHLATRLLQHPQVEGVSPYIEFNAMIEKGNKLKILQIKGVEVDSLETVSALNQYVLDEGWKNFRDNGGIILGSAIARDLGVTVGDWVSLLIAPEENFYYLTQPRRQHIQVTGILRLDGQLDHSYALIHLEQARSLLGYQQDQITGLNLKLKNPFFSQEVGYDLWHSAPRQFFIKDWSEKYGYMYQDIQLVRMLMYIAMVLMIAVSCFNIVSTLIMAVKDKQNDIAILRTLGANDLFIKRVFLSYGLQCGIKGCLIGVFFGELGVFEAHSDCSRNRSFARY